MTYMNTNTVIANPAEQDQSPAAVCFFHRLIKPLAAGGALLFLLSPQVRCATFRWAATSNRIYVEGGGSATLSDIKGALPAAPLDLVDPANHVWLLRADLWITDGSVLVLHGANASGDVDEFRLQSNNASDPGSFVSVTADWGTIDVKGTKITSWDSDADGPDTEFQTFGRAYMRVRSSLDADGVTPRQSRMDIVDSDIGYLGYDASESYGLTWKVNGTSPDPSRSIFDLVKVFGNVISSHIHDNLFGVYTFGASGCQFLNNEVDHNAGYGLDPHDDSDGLVIEGNNVHHNGLGNLHNSSGSPRGLHGIIASRRCDHIAIRNNRSWANAGNGIMLHRHCDDSAIEDNQTYSNGDSGIAIFDTDRVAIRGNLILSNSNAGIRFSVGSADCLVENNDIGFSGTNGIYFFAGSNPPEPDPADPTVTARPRRHKVAGNHIHDCGSDGLKVTNGDANEFSGNTFESNGGSLRFQNGVENIFDDNQIPTDALVLLSGSPEVAAQVHFIRQPLVNLQLNEFSTANFEDDHDAVFDVPQDVYTLCTSSEGNGRSTLVLTAADIGASATVVTRNFFVSPQAGGVLVNPTVWNLSGDLSKEWQAQITEDLTLGKRRGPASVAATIEYRVGDLAPGVRYAVYQDGKRLRSPQVITAESFTADSDGFITFSVVPGSNAVITYSVQRLRSVSPL